MQRLGRVLRKQGNAEAILYEVIVRRMSGFRSGGGREKPSITTRIACKKG
ncbi:hypothetical protein THIOM_002497 [Candidatus Thiomargarita nelsonii]|uniref:Uncharacterized protein n=1 Tax=Candidatus Thiomargarita nelsonii TaxID=1003181 RepID=A0A176S0Y2_9GAMM|nr:hypothetical protein THIOM_002497 [Candidatus Thiomargarita nelsonii]